MLINCVLKNNCIIKIVLKQDTIQKFKDEQLEKGYTVLKHKTDYKVKKDRKTGEIVDENWLTEITIGYEA